MTRSILAAILLCATATAQNFLVIQADDLGTEKLGCYGLPGAASTPHIDALALGGLRFERAYANPVCSPTRATILTGEFAHRHLIGRALSTSSPWGLDPRPATLLPKMLPPNYLKVAIGKWHLGTPETGGEWHPVLCGFDLYVGSLENFSERPGVGSNYWSFPKTYASPVGAVTVPWTGYATDDEAADAILALQVLQASGRPWFLYLNFHAIHKPWHVPPGMTVAPSVDGVEMARAMTEYLDARIGQVLAATPLATTTVIFTSDNGTTAGAVGPTPWRGVKGTVYEGGVRVPLIVADPNTAERGVKSDLIQAVDHYATMLDLAGCHVPQSADSIPWTPVLQGRAGWRSWAFCERFSPNGTTAPAEVQEAVIEDCYKLVIGETAAHELFDLWADPFERAPLSLSGLTPSQAAAYSSLLTRAHSLGF